MTQDYTIELRQLLQMQRILIDDVNTCNTHIRQLDNQYTRRVLARTVFALIEGLTYRMKRVALEIAFSGETISRNNIGTYVLLKEVLYELDDKGHPTVQTKFIPITKNVKFAFTVLPLVFGADYELLVKGADWERFKKAIGIRNRMMHPKYVDDLTISDNDLADVRGACDWYIQNFKDAIQLCMEAINSIIKERAEAEEP